ncbi:MAG: outer membrane beta-barrel protein [Bryobacteraceae bacterium]
MTKLLPVFALFAASTLWAQSGELWFSAGKSVLANRGIGSFSNLGSKDDYQLKDGFRFGFRTTFNTGVRTGWELGYAYNRSHLELQGADQGGMGIHQVAGNYLLYATKEGSRVRPFATGGIHFSNFVPPGSSVTSGGGSTKFGLNFGGGVKVAINNIWALRFDLRRYETRKPFNLYLKDSWLHQTEISAGVGIQF